MAITQAIPQKYLRFEEDHCGPYIIVDAELMSWIKERDPGHTMTPFHLIDPNTFMPTAKVLIKFSDDITAVEFKLTWL